MLFLGGGLFNWMNTDEMLIKNACGEKQGHLGCIFRPGFAAVEA
jgi:hypothetical protein